MSALVNEYGATQALVSEMTQISNSVPKSNEYFATLARLRGGSAEVLPRPSSSNRRDVGSASGS